MPPYRSGYRTRRTYRNRRNRRNNRLSTRRIYSNTSAKSQSYQIAALRNRVNYMWKTIKPEWQSISIPQFITGTATGVIDDYIIGRDVVLDSGDPDTRLATISGEKIRLRKLQFRGLFAFSPNSAVASNVTSFALLRIIVLICRNDRAAESISGYVPVADDSTQAQTFYGPLAKNITEGFTVLYDRTYMCGASKNIAPIKISLSLNHIMKYKDINTGRFIYQNQPIVMSYISTNGQTVAPRLHLGYKILFTDV